MKIVGAHGTLVEGYGEKCAVLRERVSENGKYPYRLSSFEPRLWDIVECIDLMELKSTDVVLEIGAWNNYTPFAVRPLVKIVYATDDFSWAERAYAKGFGEMNEENGTCSPERWMHEFDGYEGIVAEKADAQKLQYRDGMFDKVYSISVIEHFPEDVAAFKEIYRVLKPGGIFVFTTEFNPIHGREFSTKTGYWRSYTSDALIELISSSPFKISDEDLEYLMGEARSIDETKLHAFNDSGKIIYASTMVMKLVKEKER